MQPFSSIATIPQPLLKRLESLKLHTMTPVQATSIPAILEGKSLIVQSKTGSGKTLAFGIPLLLKVDTSNQSPQILIITPTRELAEQVVAALRAVAVFKPNLKMLTLYGGTSLRSQADSLAKGTQILIGTPGRILDHLSKGTLTLDTISHVVLDEADRMLDMGFYDDIIKIIDKTSTTRQTLLFSATFSPKVEALAASLLKDPVTIKVETEHDTQKIEAFYYETNEKFRTLKGIIAHYRPNSLLIFANTKQEVVALAQKLLAQHHSVIALHGDLDQIQRNEAVICFTNGSKRIMVATDVASRGLDIKGVDMVINYDLPFDVAVYTHRIGRTGRADASGIAISLTGTHINPKTAYVRMCAIPKSVTSLYADRPYTMQADYETLCINKGKQNKVGKGDILGTLCKEIGVEGHAIGKIDIAKTCAYIALRSDVLPIVLQALQNGTKIKKQKVKAWKLD